MLKWGISLASEKFFDLNLFGSLQLSCILEKNLSHCKLPHIYQGPKAIAHDFYASVVDILNLLQENKKPFH